MNFWSDLISHRVLDIPKTKCVSVKAALKNCDRSPALSRSVVAVTFPNNNVGIDSDDFVFLLTLFQQSWVLLLVCYWYLFGVICDQSSDIAYFLWDHAFPWLFPWEWHLIQFLQFFRILLRTTLISKVGAIDSTLKIISSVQVLMLDPDILSIYRNHIAHISSLST